MGGADDKLRPAEVDGLQGGGAFSRVVNKHKLRLGKVQYVVKLREIGRGPCVGNRNRSHRHADVEGAKRKERVIDAVLGDDHDGIAVAKTTGEEGLRDSADLGEGGGVGHRLPLPPGNVALGKEGTIRGRVSPNLKIRAEALGVLVERGGRSKQGFTARQAIQAHGSGGKLARKHPMEPIVLRIGTLDECRGHASSLIDRGPLVLGTRLTSCGSRTHLSDLAPRAPSAPALQPAIP